MNKLAPFSMERRMAANALNLDALIPRDDFVSNTANAGGRPRQTISLSDMENNNFFHHSLRVPSRMITSPLGGRLSSWQDRF